MVRIAG